MRDKRVASKESPEALLSRFLNAALNDGSGMATLSRLDRIKAVMIIRDALRAPGPWRSKHKLTRRARGRAAGTNLEPEDLLIGSAKVTAIVAAYPNQEAMRDALSAQLPEVCDVRTLDSMLAELEPAVKNVVNLLKLLTDEGQAK